jgi:RNA polymerase sigma factor (sigma-70 family)
VAFDERTGDKREYSVLEQLADSGRTPEDERRIYELNARVRTSAAQLSPALRRTFQLRDVDGLSISETARILGIPSGTVKAQLARARAKLKESMRRSLEQRPRVAKHGQKVRTDQETNLARDSVYRACVA